MITNKDIRVENGNLVLNGDKFPLDGQSPETIMEIVEDNSDTTPTENSTAPITSGGVFTALGTKQDTLIFDTTPTDASTNPVTSGGVYTADKAISDTIGDIAQTGVSGASVAAQITTVVGGAKPTIPTNADLNTLVYTAVGEYTVNGNNKNIQNVPSDVANVSFWLKTINILTNETTEINGPWKIRTQILIPIGLSKIYIRQISSGSTADAITYEAWKQITISAIS